MSDKHAGRQGEVTEAPPTVERIAHLDLILERLVAERRPPSRHLSAREVAESMIAAQLRLIRDDVETPTPDYLRILERAVLAHRASRRRRPRGISRGRFVGAALRTATAAAVGAGIEAATTHGPAPGRRELISGHGHWYDVAAADELASEQIKPFSAGGVLGYLVNDGGRLHAISSICTHMGCRLKPAPHDARLHCLCHDSWFRLDGSIIRGTAREPLPRIDLRIAGGRVYARGTSERL